MNSVFSEVFNLYFFHIELTQLVLYFEQQYGGRSKITKLLREDKNFGFALKNPFEILDSGIKLIFEQSLKYLPEPYNLCKAVFYLKLKIRIFQKERKNFFFSHD